MNLMEQTVSPFRAARLAVESHPHSVSAAIDEVLAAADADDSGELNEKLRRRGAEGYVHDARNESCNQIKRAVVAAIGPKARAHYEAKMDELAPLLPAYEFAASINGFTGRGLAILVGECGSFADYPNPQKLRKRMGLAPPDAYAMETKDGRAARAIPRRRRSVMWTLVDSLLKKDNAYRDLYLRRKREECERRPEFLKSVDVDPETGKETLHASKHCDNRARRVAEQKLLLDLWLAWNKAVAKEAA